MKLSSHTFVLEAVLVLLCIVLAFAAPGFLSAENLLNVLRNISMQGIVALGMTMVIIAGEIDLSVGSAVAFAGCWIAWLTGFFLGAPFGLSPVFAVALAVLLTVLTGLVPGIITGILRTRYGVPSFITTLALLTGLSGAAELLTNGFPLTPFPEWYGTFGGGYLLGVPVPAILFIGTFAIVSVLMNHTVFGRSVYAVGGNAEAARLSGIPVARIKTGVLVLTAGLAAVAGERSDAERTSYYWQLRRW